MKLKREYKTTNRIIDYLLKKWKIGQEKTEKTPNIFADSI
jgi:hypothetical protein